MKHAYNYYAIDTVTNEEIGWGTFLSDSELDPSFELTHKAKLLAYAFFAYHDVRVDIRACDPTSGDFNDITDILATYTTKEN